MQGTLEGALQAVTGESASISASGRIDAGAHATHQVIAFSTRSELPREKLLRAINANLPRDIALITIAEVDADFNPRAHATGRRYRYLIWNREIRSPFYEGRAAHVRQRLDETAMQDAAGALVGDHDFSAFVTVRDTSERRRRMYRAECWREGDLVIVELEASGFMRQMVRCIVGTLIQIGKGKLPSAAMAEILRSGDRRRAGDTAPAKGLHLVAVHYPSRPDIRAPTDPKETE